VAAVEGIGPTGVQMSAAEVQGAPAQPGTAETSVTTAPAPGSTTAPAPAAVPAEAAAAVEGGDVTQDITPEVTQEVTQECDPVDDIDDSARVAAAVAKVVQWDDGGGDAGLPSSLPGTGGDDSSSVRLGGGGETTDADNENPDRTGGQNQVDLTEGEEESDQQSPHSRMTRRSMARSMGRSMATEGVEGDDDSVRMAGVLLCAEIMAQSDWAPDSAPQSARASVDEPRWGHTW
jgi:hypothetical protein